MSHDQHLIESTVDELWAVENGMGGWVGGRVGGRVRARCEGAPAMCLRSLPSGALPLSGAGLGGTARPMPVCVRPPLEAEVASSAAGCTMLPDRLLCLPCWQLLHDVMQSKRSTGRSRTTSAACAACTDDRAVANSCSIGHSAAVMRWVAIHSRNRYNS